MGIRFPSPTMLDSGIYRPKFVFPANGLVTLPVSIPSVGVAGKLSNATNSSLRCNAFSVPQTQEHEDGSRNGLTVLHWSEKTSQVLEKDSYAKVLEWSKMKSQIDEIRAILTSMEDGETSISAYDTAWVALIEDVNNGEAPLFPSSLEWIAENQLPDGSWGDPHIYLAHDRIINTLACVIALKTWNVCDEKCEQGMSFLKDNIWKLQDEEEEHMLIGFEIAFPSLLEIARSLKLELPYDSPIFNDIYVKRNLKLKRKNGDDLNDLFLSCEAARKIWDKMFEYAAKEVTIVGALIQLIHDWNNERLPKKGKIVDMGINNNGMGNMEREEFQNI